MGRMLLLLTVLMGVVSSAPLTSDCVSVTIVSGKGPLDGVYHLKTEMTNRPSDVCVDGCIYFKDQQESEEYCFGVVQESEAAILQCENNGTLDGEEPCVSTERSVMLQKINTN